MISAYGQPRSWHVNIDSTGISLCHETDGLNERLDEIQAAVLRVKLADLDENLATRRRQAAAYVHALDGTSIRLPRQRLGSVHAWRNFVVHHENRDQLREALTAMGIGTALSYAPAMHLQPVYAHLGWDKGSFPVAEHSTERLLGLPIGPHLDDGQIGEVAMSVRKALSSLRN